MTAADVELNEGESLIGTGPELLFRQMTEYLVHEGKPGSHAFGPQTADKGKPSYTRESVVSAQQSRDWHTAHARSASLGVWAVSVDEVVEARTIAVDDSAAPLLHGELRAPGHCFVDYRGRSKGDERTIRAILLRAALRRGEIPTAEPSEGLFAAS